METNKIILIGYMASGKTTIGKLLAKKMNISFIDLDVYITDKENSSITEIFEEKGEDSFRKLEIKYLEKVLKQEDSFVLALGGGTPTIENAMKIITENSISFYLKASVKTLAKRLSPNSIERPLLSNVTESAIESYIKIHLESRTLHYSQADNTISVDNLPTDTIVDVIQKLSQITPKS